MRIVLRLASAIMLGISCINGMAAIEPSSRLQEVVEQAVQSALAQFEEKKLTADELSVTLVQIDDGGAVSGSYRGAEQIYPASVIKLFYLVAAHQWLEDGKIQDTPELRRAMSDMIGHSYNEATHYVIDVLTGTTSGPELSADEMEQWYEKRNAVNRYFKSLGYEKVNANRKPWCEGPYGREIQSIRVHAPNHRNWLTTDETARLLTEIAMGHAVTAERSKQMLALMKRDHSSPAGANDGQARNYTGKALPPVAKLWSKAGWTSQTRHDAAYVEMPDGTKFVLVTFTENHSNDSDLIPTVAKEVIERLQRVE